MDIYTFKRQLEQIVQPTASHSLISAEQAWLYFKKTVTEFVIDEEDCEEFCFSVGVASDFDGKQIHSYENLFQIYFSRLIDAKKGSPWQVAEINFYYRYEMNSKLRLLLPELQNQDVETTILKTDTEQTIFQKASTVLAFADKQILIWDEIRDLKPTLSTFQFWLQ